MNKKINVLDLYFNDTTNKIDKFNSKLSSKIDVTVDNNKPQIESIWIEKIDDSLESLENILKNSTNSDEENEETQINTYENRFIYTLINKLLRIIDKEKEKILKIAKSMSNKSTQIDYTGNACIEKNKVDIQVIISSSVQTSGKNEKIKNQIEKILELEKKVLDLTEISKYKQLEKEKVSLVKSPLRKKYIIQKGTDFQCAIKLWEAIVEDSKKDNTNDEKSEHIEDEATKKLFDETFLLDYLILQNIEQPKLEIKNKKEINERIISNMVEAVMEIQENITEEEIKNIVSEHYKIIKYRKQVNDKKVEEIFKKYISKYISKISSNVRNK